tara:strand:+ start:455 stop:727 length:273 start_codon:yes stop_codon:yes gene_type:complete
VQDNTSHKNITSKEVILNLNLEAMVAVGHQDKLKRDRIGIIFKRAKKNAWDSRRKKTEEYKLDEMSQRDDEKQTQKQMNHRVLYLKQDEI